MRLRKRSLPVPTRPCRGEVRPSNVVPFKPREAQETRIPVSEASAPSGEDTKAMILSVDDDDSILRSRQLILEKAGYQTISASDGKQALQCVETHNIDLVLLDYLMPEVNGGVVILHLKTTKPSIPVIIVSASPLPEHVRLLADAVVEKGNGPAYLLNKIREFLPPGSSS